MVKKYSSVWLGESLTPVAHEINELDWKADITGNRDRLVERKNLHRMVQFAVAFPDEPIVATLWRQLSWSHFRELLPLKRPLQPEFYAEMAGSKAGACAS